MKNYGFYLLSANKLVFSDRKYILGFVGVAFAMFWLLLYIPIRTIPGNDLAFQISILTPKDWFLFTILPILTALSIVMNIYILKNRGSAQDGVAMVGQGGTGFLSGVIASVFGTATCASCVASIFGFLGFGGVLFLLQYRTYITTGAIILMLISLYFTSKRVLNACESCRVGGHSKIWHSNLINKKVHITAILLLVVAAIFYFGSVSKNKGTSPLVNQALAAKFDYLSKNGNSSCSQSFQTSIPVMPDDSRLQGSCCSPMNMHRYQEQVEGLKKYKGSAEIPADPYDIEAGLAKKLLSYYDLQLTPDEQKEYDYAMQNSDEKGPCCCKCWRWYVYGGLGKLLIREKGFTGEQVTQIWNLSDGCGGEGDHVNHDAS